ncbi:questin oxidase family protein [Streptomyces sp. NPDC046332]|uniref:questin oxidase family protein n=1 Tax=Streptomyces sp. NPDC046332 TaxID=3155133 RepID=UPI0033EA4933
MTDTARVSRTDSPGTDATGSPDIDRSHLDRSHLDRSPLDRSAVDRSGVLDEALQRLHASGPERNGWLSNHAPMAVEALVRHGQAPAVHRWLDQYRPKLEDMPEPRTPVTAATWREALGDPTRIADWARFFEQETTERPWREVLAEWWPRLLPGIAAGATHPVIRTGHAVRTLLTTEETAPRRTELAHALGYWAARAQPLHALTPLAPAPTAAAALDAVPPVPDQEGGIRTRLAQLTAFPSWGTTADPDAARASLTELVTAATHRYATHGHGEPTMLVHAATAPNAVLRALPALPRELWPASLAAAWAASAAVTAAYTPREPAPYSGTALTPEEVFERAAAHGDDHTIKFADTALDVGDPLALTAAVRAIDLNPPAF